MQNWINHKYIHKNKIEGRIYQQDLAIAALKKSTMIIAPTAMGKTVIAALVVAERLRKYPNSKILFLAPSKPLTLQHEHSFKEFLKASVISMTGNDKPTTRKQLWNNNQIICATPQTIESDIISKEYNFKDVSLIIFDECHHAVGEYSYVYLAQKYIQQANHPLVLGLTASPGWEEKKIKEVASNLYIEDIIIKTEDDPDVAPYFNIIETKWIKVKLTEELGEIQNLLTETLKDRMKTLKKMGVVDSISRPSKKDVLIKQKYVRSKIATTSNPSKKCFKAISLLTEVINIMHSLELLETQTIATLNKYLSKLEKKKTKAAQNLRNDYKFNKAVILSRDYEKHEIDHPKLKELLKLIKKILSKNSNDKIIVFSQFRDTTQVIAQALAKEGISNLRFYGQASRNKEKGLTQKKQIETIDKFKHENYNVLISTSVAEEGIDIPSVDHVILYEPVPSEIRMIQRRGRTGRKHQGVMHILMTKSTIDEGYYWASQRKEQAMKQNIHKSYNNKKNTITLDNFKRQQPEIIQDNEDNLTIYVDYREKKSNITRELDKLGVNVKFENMTIGDYQITNDIIIERKSVDDFAHSIMDKRLHNQATNLANANKPMMIIEGENIYATSIHPNAIRGALTSIALDFKIPVIQTKDETDTALMLKSIAKREAKHDNKPISIQTKSKPLTLKEQQLFITESLPGIGPISAKRLLSHFKSVSNLINATDDELIKVEGIGKKTASNITAVTQSKYEE